MEGDGGTTYTAALATYALALLERPKANDSMRSLMDRATRNHVRVIETNPVQSDRFGLLEETMIKSDEFFEFRSMYPFVRRTFFGGKTSTSPRWV